MLVLSVCLLVFLLSTLPSLAQVLADGSSLISGGLSSSVKWQASGFLTQGECKTNVAFDPCFTAELASTGNKSGNNRQRIEMYSWPPSKIGETWIYEWDYFLVPGVASSHHFFHLSQLFSRKAATFLIALDLHSDHIRIFDTIKNSTSYPSIPLADFEGKTTRHHMEATFGSNGSIAYTVVDVATNLTLFAYSTQGEVSGGASLKTGLYRLIQPGQTSAKAYLGGFSFVKVE